MAITVIGTSHIAEQSVKEIERAIETQKPDIVALELDAQRAVALLHERKRKITLALIAKMGVKGYIFAKLGQFVQQKLGARVGVTPGADMKAGLLLAKKYGLEVALIDQPLLITLKNFSQELTWKEKGRFFVDMFRGIFTPQKQMKRLGLDKLDLRKVPAPELIEKMMEPVIKHYPSVYKTLVEDRNKYMVKQLVKLLRTNPHQNILVIVGAGHKKGVEELLRKVEVVNQAF